MKKKNLLLLAFTVLCIVCILAGCGGEPRDTSDVNIEDGPRTFEVTDEFFTFERYDIVIKGPAETGINFSLFTTNIFEIYGTCVSSLDKVIATIDFYDDKGKLIGTYTASDKDGVLANVTFVLSVEISDNVRDNFSVVSVKYLGETKSRDVYRVDEFTYNVTYVYNNGQPPRMIVVDWHTYLEPPDVPMKDGYDFDGWFTDPECTQRFDFENTMVSGDTVLYADYALDYIRMGQMLLASAAPATVKITTKSYTSLLMGMIELTSHTKTGEGVIIKDGSGYYYVLSTEDLLSKRQGYESVSYTVEDNYGNTYTATLKHSSEAYNLGVLYFEKGEQVLEVANIAAMQPEVNDKIAILTSSRGNSAVPDFGTVLSYERIDHKTIGSEASNINFDMMVHDAVTDVKVSGRPVFSMELDLVGIQCGTLSYDEPEFENSHVIPLEAIKRYIDAYGL